MANRADRPIALVGLMGAGKSVIARIMGERLGASVADLDDMIEAEEGRSVADIFAREGEPYFREREGQLLAATLASGARVIACGGGVVLKPSSRTLLRDRCLTVWLDIDPAVAAERLRADGRVRPLLEGGVPEDVLQRLAGERGTLYDEVARMRVAAGAGTAEEVAGTILANLPLDGPA